MELCSSLTLGQARPDSKFHGIHLTTDQRGVVKQVGFPLYVERVVLFSAGEGPRGFVHYGEGLVAQAFRWACPECRKVKLNSLLFIGCGVGSFRDDPTLRSGRGYEALRFSSPFRDERQ